MATTKNTKNTKTKTPNVYVMFLLLVWILALNSVIIYYTYYLEQKHCNCVKDYRHDYVKYFAMLNIVYPILYIIFNKILLMVFNPVIVNVLLHVVKLTYILGVGGYVYSLFTYVEDLNKTKCECATKEMKKLNKFLYYWRYVMVIGVSITILSTLLLLFKLLLK